MKLNLTKTLNKVTTNKYVLYIVLFFAITNVLGYLMTKDFDSLALFVALGVITSYFTKNMIIILGSAMFITNIAFASKKIREGMKEGISKKKIVKTKKKKCLIKRKKEMKQKK